MLMKIGTKTRKSTESLLLRAIKSIISRPSSLLATYLQPRKQEKITFTMISQFLYLLSSRTRSSRSPCFPLYYCSISSSRGLRKLRWVSLRGIWIGSCRWWTWEYSGGQSCWRVGNYTAKESLLAILLFLEDCIKKFLRSSSSSNIISSSCSTWLSIGSLFSRCLSSWPISPISLTFGAKICPFSSI